MVKRAVGGASHILCTMHLKLFQRSTGYQITTGLLTLSLCGFHIIIVEEEKIKILTGDQLQNNLLCHSRISRSFIKCCCCLDYKASRMPHGSSIIVLHNNISYYLYTDMTVGRIELKKINWFFINYSVLF